MTLDDSRPSEVAAQARAYIRQNRRVFAVSVRPSGGMGIGIDDQIEEELAETIERVEADGWTVGPWTA